MQCEPISGAKLNPLKIQPKIRRGFATNLGSLRMDDTVRILDRENDVENDHQPDEERDDPKAKEPQPIGKACGR